MQRLVCKGAACAGSLVELEESSCTGVSGIAAGGDEGSGALLTFEEHLLTGHQGAVVCLAMFEDRLLFSGSTDCTIKVYLICKILAVNLQGFGSGIASVLFPWPLMLIISHCKFVEQSLSQFYICFCQAQITTACMHLKLSIMVCC